MDEQYRDHYHNMEEMHWWFRSRREAILRRLVDEPRDVSILDVGCSSGILLEKLRDLGFENLYGIDISEDSIALARERGLSHVFAMDATATDFADESFDVIISSDSLEHIEDDVAAVREFARLLKRGGRLLLYVPAHSFLWSRHDEINHHYRRYSKKGLKRLVEHNGFRIEAAGYWNVALFLPAFLKRGVLDKLRRTTHQQTADSDLNMPSPAVNSLLTALMKLENGVRLSFLPGLSIFVEGRKSSQEVIF